MGGKGGLAVFFYVPPFYNILTKLLSFSLRQECLLSIRVGL